MKAGLMKTGLFLGIGLLSFSLLSGCGDQPQLEKIETRLHEMRTRPQGRIEELPRFPVPVIAEYTQQQQRDPFTPHERLSLGFQGPGSALKPDLERPRSLLEQWGLDELAFRGTLQRGRDIRALILTPDNQLFAVGIGDRLGRDHGTIRQIAADQVQLVELIANGSGQWQERDQTLFLSR